MTDAIKLCRDCRFFVATDKSCGHQSAVVPDFVAGNHRRRSAQLSREFIGDKVCGAVARFFEPVAPKGWDVAETSTDEVTP